MADTRSFFERLTGSVRIQDENGDKGTLAESAPEVATEIVTERPVERKSAPGRKKRQQDENTAGLSGATSSAPAFTPQAPARVQAVPADDSQVDQDEEEPEGQLTVDIYDDNDAIVIMSTVAGVSPEDLDLSVTSDMVTLKGRRRRPQVSEESYYYKELYWGSFSRSVILPEEVEADDAEASLKNGLLSVRLPKKSRHVLTKIKVKPE